MSNPPQAIDSEATRVLILGATGMLGHALLTELVTAPGLEVRGTIRSRVAVPEEFGRRFASWLEDGVNALNDGNRRAVLDRLEPHLVINAVGVIKQDPSLTDHVNAVRVNALLPHQLAEECRERGIRLVHVSTDCVFSGLTGGYREDDTPDPVDFYGRSKLLGEVEAPALTLRTSIIGHELKRHESLIDWFLSQDGSMVNGFTKAIYSGLTTVEFARLLAHVVIPDTTLVGLFHVASEPISKFELLQKVAAMYGWRGQLNPYDGLECDRSMLADKLKAATDYRPPSWDTMITEMYTSWGGGVRA